MPEECSVDGCHEPVRAGGMCRRHYDNQRRTGSVIGLQRRYPGKSPAEKLWLYTRKGPNCWEWTAGRISSGYGLLSADGRRILAHRFSYELHIGPVPDGVFVLHRCDNRLCIRPDHLFLGTQADNVADMEAKGRDHKRGQPGEQNNQARIDAAAVRAIRATRDPAWKVAAAFGVSRGLIYAIRQRRLWKHIE